VALYANAEGGPSGDVNKDVQKIIKEMTLAPPATASTSAARRRT
jgi:hypothetical protein